jgi:hypothetical protein
MIFFEVGKGPILISKEASKPYYEKSKLMGGAPIRAWPTPLFRWSDKLWRAWLWAANPPTLQAPHHASGEVDSEIILRRQHPICNRNTRDAKGYPLVPGKDHG